MTIEQQYLDRVIACLPPTTPLRSQIALELRGLIADRVERGERIEDILRQLGDPQTLAESYLKAVPLVSASFVSRAMARIIDVLMVMVIMLALVFVVAMMIPSSAFELIPVMALVATALSLLACVIYAVVAEYARGQTVGKRLFHLRVVRESGAHISLGQAIVRQLPTLMQFFWIDILFALFTDRRQRAFELLSKTRVVQVPPEERASARLNMPRATSLA
jgi:uncharacterized RDD family membrane protein YckC